MKPQPPDIRIDDLANPRFSHAALELIRTTSKHAAGLRFETDSILTQAQAEVGYYNFHDEGWRQRIDFLVRCLREEVDLSPMGVASCYGSILQWAKTRLLIEELYERHPEINEINVESPIYIVGLPRSGTTHLHNLIAADTAMRSLPFWEALEPVLPEIERAKSPDPRLARTERMIADVHCLAPHFKSMQDWSLEHVEEEYLLLATDFSTSVIETLGIMPSWREWYLATDQTPHYLYLKRCLRALQWLRGGNRWILKCPQHLEQLRPLMRAFPDAIIVFTYRDPVAVLASAVTMIAYHARIAERIVDPVKIGQYWADRIEIFLRAFARDKHLVPIGQSFDLYFHDFMRDAMATVRRVYDVAAQPLSVQSLREIEGYLETHRRGRYGRVIYNFADFGLDPLELRDRFRFYTDRFAMALEHVDSRSDS
jgi:hypothetical protein